MATKPTPSSTNTTPTPKEETRAAPAASTTPEIANEQPPTSPTTISSPFAELVAYGNWVRSRGPEDLRRLLPGVQARAKTSTSAIDQLRLAILLSQIHAPFRNDARARELVDEVIQRESSEVSLFAYTLQWELQDRTATQGECVRALAQERRQRDALKQKLNELKAIEEQIHRREINKPNTTP